MKLFWIALGGVLIWAGTCQGNEPASVQQNPQVVGAFMRIKNELPTVAANLQSIDGLFDKYVIIHSNEKDDGTVAYIEKWCETRKNCTVHEYPFTVYPSMTQKYYNGIEPQNTMAAYSNFGINQFDWDEWMVNIDGDQVYIRSQLKKVVDRIRAEAPDNDRVEYCMKGLNTFVWQNHLVKIRRQPVMGTYCDHYATKRKNIEPYRTATSVPMIKIAKGARQVLLPDIVWFHFKKVIKDYGRVYDKDSVQEKGVTYLSDAEIQVYLDEVASFFPPEHPYSLYNMTLYKIQE